jgi:hypothetical protein
MSRSVTLKAFFFAFTALAAATALPMPGVAQNSGSGDQTDSRIAAAMTGYDRYQNSHSPEDLRKTAFELIKVIDQRALRTGDVVGHRRSIVAAYAKLLKVVDSLKDPNFVPDRPPATCVTPPREPSGHQAPPCADPKDVVDPQTRAQYLAAIEQRSTEIGAYNAQMQVVGIANDVVGTLEIVLHRFHTRAPDDTAALDALLRKSGLDAARQQQIHAMY